MRGPFPGGAPVRRGRGLRDDENFAYVAAWEWTGAEPVSNKEPLVFEEVNPSTVSEEREVAHRPDELGDVNDHPPGLATGGRRGDRGIQDLLSSRRSPPDMSFLEMLDVLNERLIDQGEEPIAFDHDCREGICGSCGVMIDGQAHGPQQGTATCQLHMRKFRTGRPSPSSRGERRRSRVIRDLVVDRSAFDRIIEAGGYITAPTGSAPDANLIPIPKDGGRHRLRGRGLHRLWRLCRRLPQRRRPSCSPRPRSAHLNLLPQGQAERWTRTENMVEMMEQFFGSCTNHGECEEACPKEHLDRLHRHDERRLREGEIQESPSRIPDLSLSRPATVFGM